MCLFLKEKDLKMFSITKGTGGSRRRSRLRNWHQRMCRCIFACRNCFGEKKRWKKFRPGKKLFSRRYRRQERTFINIEPDSQVRRLKVLKAEGHSAAKNSGRISLVYCVFYWKWKPIGAVLIATCHLCDPVSTCLLNTRDPAVEKQHRSVTHDPSGRHYICSASTKQFAWQSVYHKEFGWPPRAIPQCTVRTNWGTKWPQRASPTVLSSQEGTHFILGRGESTT